MAAREGVKRMVWGGVLFAIVSPLIFVLALVLGLLSALGPIGDLDRLPPGGKAPLAAGQKVVLFVDGAQSSQAPGCTVTGPDGRAVSLAASGGTTVSVNGADWRETLTFTAGPAGDYAVDCAPMDALLVDRGMADRVARGLGLSVAAAFLLPLLTGLVGAWLFIWGLLRYRASKARVAHPGYPQPGYPAPGHPQADPLPEPPEPGLPQPGTPPQPPAPPSSSYEPPRG
jgi:hypothetical protein